MPQRACVQLQHSPRIMEEPRIPEPARMRRGAPVWIPHRHSFQLRLQCQARASTVTARAVR